MIDRNQAELPVLLTIRSEQHFEDMAPDSIELVTEGSLTPTGEGGLILSYQESELTGLEGTTTSFEVRGPQVILSRTGSVNSQMVRYAGGLVFTDSIDCVAVASARMIAGL